MTNGLDLETLAKVGEFVSGMAVVVSLIYLALQVRQNTASLRTENYARALERVADMQARLSSDGAFAGIVARGTADTARLTATERLQFTWTFYEMFGAFEFMFHQSKSNALASEVWQRWADTLSWWMSFPGVRAWWAARPAPFSASFTRYVEEQLQKGPSDPGSTGRWITFLHGKTADSPVAGTDDSKR